MNYSTSLHTFTCSPGIRTIMINASIPLPGSLDYARLLSEHPDMRTKYANTDIFDADEASNDFMSKYCKIPPETVLQRKSEMEQMIKEWQSSQKTNHEE